MIVSTSLLSIDASADVPPRSFNIKAGNYWTYADDLIQSDSTGDTWLNATTTIDIVGTNQTMVEGNLTEVYHVMTAESGTIESVSSSSGSFTGSIESTRFDARLFSNYSLVSSQQVTTLDMQGVTVEVGYSMSLSPTFDDYVGDELISLGWNTTVGTTASVTAWRWMPPFPPFSPGGNTTNDMVSPMTMTMDVVAENVPVTTPAGTFLCYEINVTIAQDLLYSGSPTAPLLGGMSFASMTLYYSYDVGNYVTSYYHGSISGLVEVYRNQTLVSYFYTTDFTPPVANAGPDRTVVAGTKSTLDGTMSTDSESTLAQLNFTWNFTYDGAMLVLYGAAPDFRFFVPGVYNVTLNVTDPGRNYDVTWVAITVIPDTSEPVAIAGPDQLITGGNWAVLDGSSSYDAENLFDELEFTWTFEYDSINRAFEGAVVMFLFEEVGNYEVTLAVSDPVGHSGVDSLWVNVTPLDFVPPVANAGPDQPVPVDTNVVFDGSESYDNVMIVNWTWTFSYDGMNHTLYGPQPRFEFNQSGTYQVILMIRDASGNMDADMMTVTVGGGNIAANDLAAIGISIALIAVILVASFLIIIYMKKKK